MQKKYLIRNKITHEIVDIYYVLSYALMMIKPDEELIEVIHEDT
jgi:hypothetical protein